jgi:hypothetical protein
MHHVDTEAEPRLEQILSEMRTRRSSTLWRSGVERARLEHLTRTAQSQ